MEINRCRLKLKNGNYRASVVLFNTLIRHALYLFFVYVPVVVICMYNEKELFSIIGLLEKIAFYVETIKICIRPGNFDINYNIGVIITLRLVILFVEDV